MSEERKGYFLRNKTKRKKERQMIINHILPPVKKPKRPRERIPQTPEPRKSHRIERAISHEKILTENLSLNESIWRSKSAIKSKKRNLSSQKKEKLDDLLSNRAFYDESLPYPFKTSLKRSSSSEGNNFINIEKSNLRDVKIYDRRHINKNYFSSSGKGKNEQQSKESIERDSAERNMKIDKPFISCTKAEKEMLHFMKNLAIILEGNDATNLLCFSELIIFAFGTCTIFFFF